MTERNKEKGVLSLIKIFFVILFKIENSLYTRLWYFCLTKIFISSKIIELLFVKRKHVTFFVKIVLF